LKIYLFIILIIFYILALNCNTPKPRIIATNANNINSAGPVSGKCSGSTTSSAASQEVKSTHSLCSVESIVISPSAKIL